MGIKILRLRHHAAPAQNGCRWCGFDKLEHANRWVPGHKWHNFVEPTDAQRKARLKAGAGLNIPAPGWSWSTKPVASDVRTRL